MARVYSVFTGILLLAFFLQGCPKNKEGLPKDVEGLLNCPEGSSVLVFSIKLPGKPPMKNDVSIKAKANLVKKRLIAFGIENASVTGLPPSMVRVQLQSTDPQILRQATELITRPAHMAITPVMPAKSFFKNLQSRLSKYAGLRLAKDQLGVMRVGRSHTIWYLISSDREVMENAIREIKPPDGKRLVPMWSDTGAVAFLVNDPAPIENPVLTHIHTTKDTADSSVSVIAKLAKPFRDEFSDLVRRNLDRPLAFIVNNQLVAMPVVGSKIRRGSIEIRPSPMANSVQSTRQAEELAVRLKSWQLVGKFELTAKRINSPEDTNTK